MCIEPGDYTVQAMECLDKQRLLRAKYYCLQKQRKGFGTSSIPYKEFKDELGSTSEEVKVEPVIYYNCAYCDYRSSTQKGLRCHRLTVHKIGVGTRRTLDAHGRPLSFFLLSSL
ncbi:uncharacterized protein TNCV_2503581 [Trichonephila clavipes]|nr:uncharacterized protein TNCV_2503581 [Trichonephila clavipes]